MHFTIYYQLCPCHMPESQLPMTSRQSQPQSHAPPPRLRLHTPPREHTPSCKMTKPPLRLGSLYPFRLPCSGNAWTGLAIYKPDCLAHQRAD